MSSVRTHADFLSRQRSCAAHITRAITLFLATLLILLHPGATAAAPPDNTLQAMRSGISGRVVQFFDFEEADVNPNPVPVNWFRVQNDPELNDNPGFPLWNRAAFSTRHARSGFASIALPTQGGSTALRLAAGIMPIFPAADYVVTAAIFTEGVSGSRACVVARLLDAQKEPIPGSEVRSDLIRSEGEWTPIALKVVGAWQQAAFLQLDLQLLQPRQYQSASILGKHQVWDEDTKGAAYFDDIGIFQLPRLTISTGGRSPIVHAPEKLSFTGNIRDLTGEDLTAQLTLRDTNGSVIATETVRIGPGGGDIEWAPAVDKLGWYEASLDVTNGPSVVGSAGCAVLYAPAPVSSAAAGSRASGPFQDVTFGVALSRAPSEQIAILPELLPRLGLHAATLPIVTDHQMPEWTLLSTTLERLLSDDVSLTFAMPTLTHAVANELKIDPIEPLILADHPDAAWLPSIQTLIETYGHRVPRWQLGVAPLLPSWTGKDLSRRMTKLRASLERLMPAPRLSIPWMADVAWPDPPPGRPGAMAPMESITVTLPSSFPSSAIPEIAERWRAIAAAASAELHVIIETDDHDPLTDAVSDEITLLMQRTALLWQALSMGQPNLGDRPLPRLSIRDPWAALERPGTSAAPSPLLGVWSNLAQRFTGRRVVASLDNLPGVKCYILKGATAAGTGSRSTGLIVAWADNTTETATLRGYFTPPEQTLTALDPFGNPTTIRPVDSSGRYEIPLSQTPILLEGVDTELARFSSGFEVTPSFVPAVAAVHEHEIILTNPWPVRISGDLHLPSQQTGVSRQPWRFTPSSPITFTIPPGGTARLPFSFSFSSSEEAGARTLVANVRITADRSYPPMRLSAPITIGLEDLDLQASIAAGPTPDGPDLVVNATVTNAGKSPRTLQVELVANGQARQKLPISNLGAGESAVRRFVIRGAAQTLAGKRLRVTLVDVDGLERLNKFVQAP